MVDGLDARAECVFGHVRQNQMVNTFCAKRIACVAVNDVPRHVSVRGEATPRTTEKGEAMLAPDNRKRQDEEQAIVDEGSCPAGPCALSCPRRCRRPRSRDILEVASPAPSGTNMQPWKVYVTQGAVKQRLSDAILNSGVRAKRPSGKSIAIIPSSSSSLI